MERSLIEAERESAQTNILMPPEAELQILYMYSQRGLVRNVSQHLDTLIETNPQDEAFAQPLLTLVQQFQIEEVEELLKSYLSQLA